MNIFTNVHFTHFQFTCMLIWFLASVPLVLLSLELQNRESSLRVNSNVSSSILTPPSSRLEWDNINNNKQKKEIIAPRT
jgi:hypothetical protein